MIKAIVTDIEGTTSSISFVHDVLFPYAKKRIADFVRNADQLGDDEQQEIINYRMQGDRYIVDGIPEKVILIAGVGGNQERITITKGE